MTARATLPRIFVQIASYRDPECHATVRDLFEKAARPERIFVGICWQYDPAADAECFASDYPRADQVRVIQYHIRDAQGAGWARNEAQSLWQGEEYTLQIQAHMRFELGWDDTLIERLEALPTQKSALTGWLPGYTPPDRRDKVDRQLPFSVVNRLGGAGDAQMIHLIKRLRPAEEMRGRLLPVPLWVGNFLFCRSEAMKEVPSDPHVYFWGEEINLSARLWTHGYDLYHLDRPVLYHYWDRVAVKDAAMYRDHQEKRNRLSLMRNLHLLGMKCAADKAALKEIEKYGLGSARSLAEYWKFAGLDLAGGRISRKAKEGRWSMDASVAPGPRPRIFAAIASYRDPECAATLTHMFAKAAHPERVFAGVCLQFDPGEDKDCLVKPGPQIRIRQVDYRESEGAGWARNAAHGLWQGEEYVMQIDSHMRFEPGWDEALIGMLAACPSEKPVLSTYLPNYDPPDRRDRLNGEILRVRVRKFGGAKDPQLIHISGSFAPLSDARAGLYPTPFVVNNFLFGRAAAFREVPIDPHFHFYGDEISHSARLWTHGYDIFQPDRLVLYHYWVRRDRLHQHGYRDTRTAASQRSLARVKHLLGMEQSADTAALYELDKYGLGKERELDVLWKFAGIDWQNRKIAAPALEGHWNMAAKKKTKKASAKAAPALPRIFVQIASYRDPDCQHTVKDLFDKAAHPERINVGIVWQTVKGEDDICFKVPYPRPKQVRVQEVDARESKGVCWARNMAQQLWDGEEFTLQIDSHMRFEPGWDDMLLSMWEECGNKKAVLTCYPPGFTPPDTFQRKHIFGMSAKEFDKNGIFLMRGAPAYTPDKLPEKPIPGAFFSACMFFGPASLIKDVPYDPHLYFFGEEISMGVRAWTHGYDIYHPNRLVLFHDWDRSKRPTHFSDHKDWTKQNQRSFARVRHLLGTEISNDPEIVEQIERYGLGTARTLDQYQSFSGVNFATKTISERALKGDFPAPGTGQGAFMIGKSNGKGDGRIFVQIASYRDPECQWTVKDLFERAAEPDRISVGICWQFDPEEDKHCFEVSTRPDQVRMLPVDWREAEGVCWARNQTQQLWEGEEYTLQIDSHMRFTPGWDEALKAELAACPAERPLLSCSPASYVPPDQLQANPKPTVRRVQPFTPEGNIRGKGEYIDRSPEVPLNAAFIAAGFMFSKGKVIEDVPYDPYLYFDQEEITHAARLYTHGWDVFSTRRPLIYHYYNDGKQNRALHWRDLRQEDEKKIIRLRARGLKRFNHITGHTLSNEHDVVQELDVYGLGRARSLQQFEEYSGIDFKRKIATERALRCQFIKGLEKYRDRPIHVPELDGPVQANGKAPPAAAQPKAPPPVQQSAPQAAAKMLEPGDFVPLLEIEDTNRKMRGIEVHGGRHSMMFFLPRGNEEYVTAFFRELGDRLAAAPRMEMWQIFVLGDTAENLVAFKEKHKLNHVLWADPGNRIARAFGVDPASGVGFLLNNNLKIEARHAGLNPGRLAEAMVADCRAAIERQKLKFAEQRVISETPPVLIVPDAFSPEFCARCIHEFRTGHTFEGTVGADAKLGYRPGAKVRTDFIVSGKLLEEFDDKLSRSFFPEIKKVFGFEVTHREAYKIGMYSGEKGGFFRQHRDNFDNPLGYRRIAFTLHLNDDYEGGGLRLPEYDDNIYRPARGSAIAFSCATLHEARPVTKGERFVVVGFIHGEEDEAYRRHYLAAQGKPLKEKDFLPALRKFPGLKQSRDFFKGWREENVSFDAEASPAAAPKPAAPAIITTLNGHKPKKVFESKQAIIFDDFLPEDVYQKLNHYALTTDYEHINTKGKIARAWHVHDGFPLRSLLNLFYYADGVEKPKGDYVYPTKTPMDTLIDHLLAVQPHIEHLIGKQGTEWAHLTATSWIYPQGTGLSMHDDGSGVYTGAYVYFLNPVWKPHWGGLLIMPDEEANRLVYDHRKTVDQGDFYRRKWLHANAMDELIMQQGFGKCIFPKKNRIVFIDNEAYHMVTRVNEAAGDNNRMSIAGFYNRKKEPKK